MIFTLTTLQEIKATGKRHVISDESRPGLAIKVSAFGNAAYYFRYRQGPKKGEVALGTDFAQALLLYQTLRGNMAKGEEPAKLDPDDVENDRLFKVGIDLQELIKLYYKGYVLPELSGHSARNYEMFLNQLEDYARNHAVKLYRGTCTMVEARKAIKELLLTVVRSKPILSNRMKSCYSSMFKWASRENDLVNDNPVVNMPTGIENPKDRHLDPAELKVLFPVLQYSNYAQESKDALILQLLTGLRPGEVRLIRGSMIKDSLTDDAGKYIHLKDTKNKLDHIVPLVGAAARIVKRYSKLKPNERLFKVSSWGLRQVCIRACKKADITVCSPHDLRRTFATNCGQLSVPTQIIELLLNHSATDVTSKHYQRFLFLGERREALGKMSAFLEKLGLVV